MKAQRKLQMVRVEHDAVLLALDKADSDFLPGQIKVSPLLGRQLADPRDGDVQQAENKMARYVPASLDGSVECGQFFGRQIARQPFSLPGLERYSPDTGLPQGLNAGTVGREL